MQRRPDSPSGWFEADDNLALVGEASFGQTHVIREGETRWAPDLIAERATMLLFEPELEVPFDTDMRVAAWRDGTLLGVMP